MLHGGWSVLLLNPLCHTHAYTTSGHEGRVLFCQWRPPVIVSRLCPADATALS